MRKVLIIRFSSFGDIVLLFPAIEFLSQQGNQVHVLTKDKYKPLFELFGSKVQIHTIRDHASISELTQKTKQLKAQNFDFIYDLHRNLRSKIVTFLLNTQFKRIKKPRIREFFLFLFKRKASRFFWPNIFLRKEESLKLVGCTNSKEFIENYRLKLENINPSFFEKRTALDKNFVCINPDSAWKTKMWSMDSFLEIEKKLLHNNLKVVWLGLDKSLPVTEKMGVTNWISKLSVPELALVLSQTRLLVCNDAGLMHLAEAVGTPVVSIFGPTTKELGFAPTLLKSKIVEKDLWCRPCSKSGKWCYRLIQKQKCLKLVKSDDVWSSMKLFLDNGK